MPLERLVESLPRTLSELFSISDGAVIMSTVKVILFTMLSQPENDVIAEENRATRRWDRGRALVKPQIQPCLQTSHLWPINSFSPWASLRWVSSLSMNVLPDVILDANVRYRQQLIPKWRHYFKAPISKVHLSQEPFSAPLISLLHWSPPLSLPGSLIWTFIYSNIYDTIHKAFSNCKAPIRTD